jgi:glycerophosphoryl diester phosphodiesterase
MTDLRKAPGPVRATSVTLPGRQVDFVHWPYPSVIAHRGGGRLAPENTLAALRLGAAHGHTMFEFDVKLTGDGKPILMHDASLERTTNGWGLAGTASLSEIAQLDAGAWYGPAWAGEPVPIYANVVAWLLANRMLAIVEIKPSPGRESETGAVVAMASAMAWQGCEIPPLLSSFSPEALAAAQRVTPALPRALLLHRWPSDWLPQLRRLECVAIDVNHEILDRERIQQARGEGFRVLTYTPNDPARVEQLREWGVDCVITDAIDLIKP